MTFNRRTLWDVLLVPLAIAAFAALCWHAVYAGPVTPDKITERLQERADAALTDPEYDWAMVEMDGQTAILSGTAPTHELQVRANRLVLASSGPGGWLRGGVVRVVDETEVLPAASPYVLQAEIFGDRVRLAGLLPGTGSLQRFTETLADLGYDSDAVRTDISYRDGVPEGDWNGAFELGLEQLARLDQGRVILSGKRLLLEGQSDDPAVRNDVLLRMARPPSGFSTDVDLTGNPLWSVRLSGDVLRFSGAVPDAADRTELVELASRVFFGEIIDDMGVRPMTSRDWLEGVRTALPGVTGYQSGQMVYTGDSIVISGDTFPSVMDFLREDLVGFGTLVDFYLYGEIVPVRLASLENFIDTGVAPSPEQCAAALEEALQLSPLNFEFSKDEMSRETGPLLDGVFTVLQACPDQVFVVDAATYAGGRHIAGKNLTEARQTAFGSYFIAHGVPLDQIEFTEVVTDRVGLGSVPDTDPDRQVTMRMREFSDD